VQLGGLPVPRFVWYVNGLQMKPSPRMKTSYENGSVTLIIFNVQASDAGDYMLKATNELGEVTCKTVLNVQSKLLDVVLKLTYLC
jgi:hypothetical protein